MLALDPRGAASQYINYFNSHLLIQKGKRNGNSKKLKLTTTTTTTTEAAITAAKKNALGRDGIDAPTFLALISLTLEVS